MDTFSAHAFHRTLLLCAVLLSLASVTVAQSQATGGTSQSIQTPQEVSLRLKGLDGKSYDLADMRGEVVMVSFGATWCAPCIWELAAIEELKTEYRDKPVRFLWVSIDDEKQTSNALLRHYAKTYRLTIPVLRDPLKETFAQFSTSVRIPLVVFFDREGKFAAPAHRGMTQEPIEYKEHMRRRINALLVRKEQKAPSAAGASVK